ncbi:hypothetical protein [Lacinutrix sp.]|uniref:hypothetical protein n=1 Tax=Lacinutrix sp. TaxID=1937692 RepID=UPI0025C56F4A|nr:hypothetical protein [Lacinutrix sp.]
MKLYKSLVFLSLYVVILISFTNCKSSKQVNSMEEIEHTDNADQDHTEHAAEGDNTEAEHTQVTQGRGKQTPLFIRETYFQTWIAGKQAGGSGINIYFPMLINQSNYKLEKVYFRGMIGDMQSGKASHFANLKSNNGDLVMSNDENAEYGNTIPTKQEPFPFKLESNECMISYIDNGKIQYFQVYNIIEKKGDYFPSAPPKKD